MKPDGIEVEVTGDTVRIYGEREKEEKERTFHRVERHAGSLRAFVELSSAVKEDKVAAEYKDGVLPITLPKSEAARTHKITVRPIGK